MIKYFLSLFLSLLAFNPEKEILLPNALVLSPDPTPKPNESFDGAKIDPAGRRIEDDDEDCSNEFGSAIFFYFDTYVVIKSDEKILKCPVPVLCFKISLFSFFGCLV